MTSFLKPLRPRAPASTSLLLIAAVCTSAIAQEQTIELDPIEVVGEAPPAVSTGGNNGVSPATAEAARELRRIPGAATIVSDRQFKNTPARTIKDVVEWVPGFVFQPRWGADGRVSIRGSGLTRNYGNRGLNVYMDGIPVNTSDGLFDLFEIDPAAYDHVEVFKGANALRFGANSLGGAVNFVSPTGRDFASTMARLDGGSFGFVKGQASTGGVAGAADYFITGSAQSENGYRDHSDGHLARGSANFGYQIAPELETRFYLNANSWRQRLPGEVTKAAALNAPREADSEFVRLDQQRNIDSVRAANKTTLRLDNTTVEVGIFGVDRHVEHPIYLWLDYSVRDYGGFARATNERTIGGFNNRLVAGVNVHNGTIDYTEYVNLTGAVKGPLVTSSLDRSENYSVYAENSFYVRPDLALIVGGQFLHATRDRQDRVLADGDQSGDRSYDLFSPKVGVLWDVEPGWQVFGNISRSGEAPSFDANTFATPASTTVDAQTATTYEVGTRGQRDGLNWEVALYRSQIDNEFQCLRTSPYSACSVVNADRTVHQGVEAGIAVELFKSTFADEDGFWLNVAYTYNDFFFDEDARYGNNMLPGAPPHNLKAEVLYKHPNGFYAGPNVEWVPREYFADNANQVSVNPYALLNFRLGYEREKGWSGYMEGRNLFDIRYISSTIVADTADQTSALFNPGTGLAVYAGVNYRW